MNTTTFNIIEKNGSGKANGTSFQGTVSTTLENLINHLGEPLEGSWDGKTTAQWVLEFEDGGIVTIYDWKMGKTPKDIYDWHIGGKSKDVVDRLQEALGMSPLVFTKSKF